MSIVTSVRGPAPRDKKSYYHPQDAALYTYPGSPKARSITPPLAGFVFDNGASSTRALQINEPFEDNPQRQSNGLTVVGLLEVLPTGVVILDRQGKIKQCNPAAEKLLGSGLLEQYWRDVITASFNPQEDDGHEVSLISGKRVSLMTRSLLAGEGQLIVINDLTETRELQNQLNRHQRLSAMRHGITLVGWAFLFMAAAMIFITAIDIPIQMFQHSQKLRMTLQQVKDEMKDSDGRPEIKQKIRQLQQQMASNRMMQDVPMADVVITNPEHYSVALRYDQSIDAAPIVLAKGADLVALKIREIATENEIPIVSAPPLARAVYFNTDIGGEIPSGLYLAVAQVLAYIYQLRQWARGQIKKPKLDTKFDIPAELRHD